MPRTFTPFEPLCSPSPEAAVASLPPSLPTAFLPVLIHRQELLFSCPLFPPSFPVPTGTWAVPGSQNGNGPEIVTAGLQCLLDITSTSSFWAEPGPCLSFPPSEGIPRLWSGAAAPCFSAKPRAWAGKRDGSVRGWHCARCQWLWPCLGVLGMALEVEHAALTLLFPLRDAVSPKYPRFGTLFLFCTK